MNFTQKMQYMVLGGFLVLPGYILAIFNNDSVAQSGAEDVTFGIITCRRLQVIHDEGESRVVFDCTHAKRNWKKEAQS